MTDQPYGSYPSMPGEPLPPPAAQGPPPAPVRTAVNLMFARAALGLLGLLALYTGRSTIEDTLRRAQPGASTATITNSVNTTLTVAATFAVVFTVLYVLLALQVRKGRSWARIVAMALSAVGLLSAVTAVLGEAPALSRLLSVVQVLVDLGILALLARKESAEFFRRRG